MDKEEVQRRVLKDGKPLALSKFNWDEETKTFSSKVSGLVMDFSGIALTINAGSGSTINAGPYSTINAGSGSTIKARSDSTINAGSGSTIKAGGENIVVVNRNVFEVIQPNKGDKIQICPCNIKGHLINGLYDGKSHIIADGILSEIIHKRGDVYTVINHGEKEKSYLIKQGEVYSHGATVKEASGQALSGKGNDLIRPWKEKRTGFIAVYQSEKTGEIAHVNVSNESGSIIPIQKDKYPLQKEFKKIAIVQWTEGEGL
jgi:hypothetical protein